MNIFIKYLGIVPADAREALSIPAIMKREGSYVDSPAYVEGIPNVGTPDEDETIYGKSIYATNVYDDEKMGALPGLAPLANTTTPYAWFARAAKVAVDAAGDPEKNVGVTFTVADTDSAAQLYWMQMGDANADRYIVAVGDYVTIIPVSADLPEAEHEGSENPSALKWFEKTAAGYVLSADTELDSEKTYYAVVGLSSSGSDSDDGAA